MVQSQSNKSGIWVIGAVIASVVVAGAAGVWWRFHRRPVVGPVTSTSAPPDSSVPAPSASAEPEPTPEEDGPEPSTLQEQREALFRRMQARLGLADSAMSEVRAVFDGSKLLGQGNPKVTTHPMTRAECRKRRSEAGLKDKGDDVCQARLMSALFNRKAGETIAQAKVCIDQYEYPGYPCEYPVVLPRASEAEKLCQAIGKRLCDAHEWEGACAGSLLAVEDEYRWSKERIQSEYYHNKDREIVWAYGPTKDHKKCATGSHKNAKCNDNWSQCGSNTYPTGAFPECVSSFGVFDQHGNAAEHMNLPMTAEELVSRGGSGWTEMKGSWFIFLSYEAHKDDCRWRAPDWHGTKVRDPESHRNYHLGFRCCKDIPPKP